MTVRELLSWLKDLDPDTLVILSIDEEGNAYSPVGGWGSGKYAATTVYSGDVYNDDDTAPESAKPCYVLYPLA